MRAPDDGEQQLPGLPPDATTGRLTCSSAVADADAQRLRVLPGRFVAEHLPADAATPDASWLSLVRAPDGLTVIRSAHPDGLPDAAGRWVALYSGDTAHAPEATGMLGALLVPLAQAGVPVLVASTYVADLVLVPEHRRDDATRALRAAGHHVDDAGG